MCMAHLSVLHRQVIELFVKERKKERAKGKPCTLNDGG